MKQDKIRILREDVVIPDVVWKKTNDAYDIINRVVEQNPNKVKTDNKTEKKKAKSFKTGIKRPFILAAVIILMLGIVGFGYCIRWARGFENELHVTEKIKSRAAETKLVDFPEQSITCGGITITAKQSIVDNYYAYLSFEVKGYNLPDGAEPGFESAEVVIGGENAVTNSYFYDGTIAGENGQPIYEDGSALQNDVNGNLIVNYKGKDGTLEYHINLSSSNQEGYFLNKPIRVTLRNLGTYSEKKTIENKVNGEWIFNWILQGSDEIYKRECNAPLGDTGVSVIGIEISPISIKAIYDVPRQIAEEQILDEETGLIVPSITYPEPLALSGVKMKDGTLYPYLYLGPGLTGYVDETSSRYVEMFAIDRILDVNQVEALLFRKEVKESGFGTEEDYYVVEIGA